MLKGSVCGRGKFRGTWGWRGRYIFLPKVVLGGQGGMGSGKALKKKEALDI